MNNEKRLKFGAMTAIIIAILLVAVLLYIFSKAPFDSGKEKINELKRKLAKDISELRMAQEKKLELTQKAHDLLRVLVLASIALFILLNGLLVYIGIDFIQALEGTTLVIGAVGAISSIYTFNRISINALLEMAENRIVLWVYKKNDFDPEELTNLEMKVRTTKIQLNNIQGLIN